jgi:DNA repair protein RadA/Sms
VAIGCNFKRLQLLLAILNKHTRVSTFRRSVFVNVVAGLKMLEPSTDLPIAMAAASSILNAPIPCDVVLIGELGLAGELRRVSVRPPPPSSQKN